MVDALPCASETFLAQLDTVALPAARTLHAMCETRVRADKETCALDASLGHVRARMPGGDHDATDLAEALLVRHLAARCHEPAFGVAARAWVADKPEPIGRALASRLARL